MRDPSAASIFPLPRPPLTEDQPTWPTGAETWSRTKRGSARSSASTRRIAVLGIKTEAQASKAAFYVPHYLAAQGVEIVPVPVYYPEVQQILGRHVYRKLADVPG